MQRHLDQGEFIADLSQSCLLAIIQHYIRLRDAKAGQPTDQAFLDFFIQGHCAGLSVLCGFGLLLSAARPDRDQQNCDDAEWFEHTLRQLTHWNGQNPDDIADVIEPFISKIVFFQSHYKVLSLLKANGENLHESAAGIDKNYHVLEYIQKVGIDTEVKSLAKNEAFVIPVFSNYFPQLLEAALPKNRMVVLSSKSHLMCATLTDDGVITYFDPRFPEGRLRCHNFDCLAEAIQRSIQEINDPPVLCVDIYSLPEQPALNCSHAQAVREVMEKNKLFDDLTFKRFVGILMANISGEHCESAVKLYLHSLSTEFSIYRALFYKDMRSIYGFFQTHKASESPQEYAEFYAECSASEQNRIELTCNDWVIDIEKEESEEIDLEANRRLY